jgi:hypothetical protein
MYCILANFRKLICTAKDDTKCLIKTLSNKQKILGCAQNYKTHVLLFDQALLGLAGLWALNSLSKRTRRSYWVGPSSV